MLPPGNLTGSINRTLSARRGFRDDQIVDFDKEKGRSQAKPAPAAERPRGIKIVETE